MAPLAGMGRFVKSMNRWLYGLRGDFGAKK
jgi:hypothetical protein